MNNRFVASILALTFAVLLASSPAAARDKKGSSTEPGTYKEWKGEIDEIQILAKFSAADYHKIVVRAFDASGTKLPEKDDNTYEPVKKVLANSEPAFIKGLKEDLAREKKLAVEKGDKSGAGVLVIATDIDTMDPGSKAKRYWGGFGAGAARTKLSITISDGASRKALLKFTQERRSGVGALGGDYEELLNRNLEAIGKDCALIINAF